jgi:hypothetical protein
VALAAALAVLVDQLGVGRGTPGAFGAALRIGTLVVGASGLWGRIGFSSAHVHGPTLLRLLSHRLARTDEIPWERVTRITDDHVIVRNGDVRTSRS